MPGRPRKDYSQVIRVIGLYDRLHRGERLRASELARELRTTARTLQRDFVVLREVLESALDADLLPDLKLKDRKRLRNITVWQVMGVSLGMQMMHFMSGRSFNAQLKPVLSALQSALPSGPYRDARELARMIYVPEAGQKLYRDNERLLEILHELIKGLLLQHPIELSYLSPRRRAEGKEPRPLRVHPLCLVIHRGAAYFVVDVLDGSSDSSDRRRLLTLDRMSDVRVDTEAEALTYPRDFQPAAHFRSAFGVWRGDETHEVRLSISRTYADAVRERTWHPTQKTEELSDGSLRLSIQLGNLDEIADWVLGMGEHAHVEAPTQLAEKIKARLEQTLRQYR